MELEMAAGSVLLLTIGSMIVNLVILIYVVHLASKFVTAFESMAGSLGRIASQQGKQERSPIRDNPS
ncbi:MAG: hypothetical protein GXP29_00790 [Planctomycetes bacterium]|nr:hypothetical protein [Planctomycetota bacterium]